MSQPDGVPPPSRSDLNFTPVPATSGYQPSEVSLTHKRTFQATNLVWATGQIAPDLQPVMAGAVNTLLEVAVAEPTGDGRSADQSANLIVEDGHAISFTLEDKTRGSDDQIRKTLWWHEMASKLCGKESGGRVRLSGALDRE